MNPVLRRLRDDRTFVTLVNVSPTTPRTVIVQGGGYGEHQILSADVNGHTTQIHARDFTVRLAPGAGAKVTLSMKRYANPPTAKFPVGQIGSRRCIRCSVLGSAE